MEHKELLYFLSLQIKLYQHLIQKRDAQAPLTLREKEFIELYEDIRKKIRKEYHNLYKSGKINKKERLLLSSDEYNRIIAEKVGVKYGKEYF